MLCFLLVRVHKVNYFYPRLKNLPQISQICAENNQCKSAKSAGNLTKKTNSNYTTFNKEGLGRNYFCSLASSISVT